eukprot:2092119-Amphidinium_carterae.1
MSPRSTSAGKRSLGGQWQRPCGKSSEREAVVVVVLWEVVWRHYRWESTTGSTPWGQLPGQAPENRLTSVRQTNPGVDRGGRMLMVRVAS